MNSNVCRVMQLTSSKDFFVYVYVCEGSTFNMTKRKEEIKVERVNIIEETENEIIFYHFDSPVGVFSRDNVICYVARS